MDLEKCKKCPYTIGDKSKPEELGCTKTYDWTIIKYIEKCPLKINSKRGV